MNRSGNVYFAARDSQILIQKRTRYAGAKPFVLVLLSRLKYNKNRRSLIGFRLVEASRPVDDGDDDDDVAYNPAKKGSNYQF